MNQSRRIGSTNALHLGTVFLLILCLVSQANATDDSSTEIYTFKLQGIGDCKPLYSADKNDSRSYYLKSRRLRPREKRTCRFRVSLRSANGKPVRKTHIMITKAEFAGSAFGCVERGSRVIRTNKRGIARFTERIRGWSPDFHLEAVDLLEGEKAPLIDVYNGGGGC